MGNDIFRKLQETLNSIPNGFPKTESGIEIQILKKIFSEEEADIATKMKLKFETSDAIASRIDMDADLLENRLKEMSNKGQILGVALGGTSIYRLMPFVFGIYEYQLPRLDKEFAELTSKYWEEGFGDVLNRESPAINKVVPIEKEIPAGSAVETYESVTKLIESGKAWAVDECICKKEKHLMGEGCEYPLEVCLGIAPVENFFDDFFWGKPLSKEEAMDVIKMTEEAGLIHMTSNVQNGHIYICNCCYCCCGLLKGMKEFGNIKSVAHSNYVAVVDEDACTACGICVDRCQIEAITMEDIAAVADKCIGCGICTSSCPSDALHLKRKDDSVIEDVPKDEKDWWEKTSKMSGDDSYKKLL